jgi:hypothetical protein
MIILKFKFFYLLYLIYLFYNSFLRPEHIYKKKALVA